MGERNGRKRKNKSYVYKRDGTSRIRNTTSNIPSNPPGIDTSGDICNNGQSTDKKNE